MLSFTLSQVFLASHQCHQFLAASQKAACIVGDVHHTSCGRKYYPQTCLRPHSMPFANLKENVCKLGLQSFVGHCAIVTNDSPAMTVYINCGGWVRTGMHVCAQQQRG
jgi:hypothetical protein